MPIKHECVFKGVMIRENVNPRLAKLDPKFKFGAFQKVFREEHCATLNPYAGACPYRAEDCALAYYADVIKTYDMARPRTRVGYFRKVTRAHASIRADDKPLTRHTEKRTDGQPPVEPGREERRELRTTSLRSIGDLFGGDDS